MYEVLIYLLDEGYDNEVRNLFRGNDNFDAIITHDMADAIVTGAEELMDLVLIWPAKIDKTKELLKVLAENDLRYLPVIALIEDKEQVKEILSLPITDYISLPIPQEEFFIILNEIVKDLDVQSTVMEGMNWQGSLKEYNLIDLIQMVEDVKDDARLTLSSTGKTANVYFKDGKLIHAELLNFVGELVLHKLIFWTKGSFQIKFSRLVSVENSIESANQDILLMLAHDFSEWDKHYRNLPDQFDEIVVNPFTEPQEVSPLQKEILSRCESPISIFDLLLLLEDENTVIIQEIRKLFETNMIGKRREIESLVISEQKGHGFTKIFSSIASVFRKKEELSEIKDIGTYDEPGGSDREIAGINFEHFCLAKEEKQNIIKKIDALI